MLFLIYLNLVAERLADFAFYHSAKPAPQTVNGNFHGTFIQAELARGFGLGNVFDVARQPWLESFELCGSTSTLLFPGKSPQGTVE